jgi:hypothetical protein
MDVLARSKGLMLLAVGAGAAYVWLAYMYWFRIPLIGVAVATTCFIGAFVLLALQ